MTSPATAAAPFVLIVTGTDFHPFDRLVGWVEDWVEEHPGAVQFLVQHGTSRPPRNAVGVACLSHAELEAAMAEADVVVTHGGPATITEARSFGHLPICVPRDPSHGEHVDDHQQRFARRLPDLGLAVLAETAAEWAAALDAALDRRDEDRAALMPVSRIQDQTREAVGQLVHALTGCRRVDLDQAQPRLGSALPAVDVVVATRDRPQLLREAIGSITAQDYPGDIRVIVVFDQHEPDWSLEVDDPHRRVTVIENKRTPGLAGARNSGILNGDAELIGFCDDDDRWLPGKLSAQVTVLQEDPGAVLVSCGIRVQYGDTVTDRVLAQDDVGLRELLRSRLVELHPSTFVFPRAAMVDGFGLVAEDLPGSFAEDYELLLRAARAGRVRTIPVIGTEVLWHRRSYFTARWETIAEALTWLLEQYPAFRAVPKGYARVRGQIAFADAARGRRRAALSGAAATVRASPREARAYLAVAVATGLVSGDRVLDVLQRHGKGI